MLDLQAAAREIRQAARTEKEAKARPYFFLVGAGVSAPTVPTASQIQADCEKRARGDGVAEGPVSSLPIETYSYWFEKAFPHSKPRQRYLRGLIEGKPIAHACLRLAHILHNGNLANIVVTPNFDDFISRSLSLFGVPHVVCDHPKTVGRIDPEQPDVQILHVHGSYWFYDCRNLRHEITGNARPEADSVQTMPAVLDRILASHSPLVIGYSGWEGDVVMNALKRRLGDVLPYNLYWFCYRAAEAEHLPSWLRDHPSVRLVVPQRREPRERTGGPGRIAEEPISTARASGETGDTTLSAEVVLDEIVRSLELETPHLASDPIGFFAEHLQRQLPMDPAARADGGPYFIAEIISRVRRAKERDDAEWDECAQGLANMRDAMRRSQYREAITVAAQIPMSRLNVSDLADVQESVWNASTNLFDDSTEELDGYDLVVRALDALAAKQAAPPSLEHEVRVAKSLLYRGITLGNLGRSDQEIAAYDAVVSRYGRAREAALREQVAKALINKGVELGDLGRIDEELGAYDAVIHAYGEAPEPVLHVQVAQALVNRGLRLGSLNRSEEAIDAYDEVIRRCGGAPEAELREQVAQALVNKGLRLSNLDRSEEAIDVYDEVVQRFGEATNAELRQQVARALFNRGVRYGHLHRSDDEIAAYDEVVRRFGEAPEVDLRSLVARALVNKGFRLGKLDRGDEDVAAYDELVRWYGDAPEADLREQTARALVNKAIALRRRGRLEDALATCDDVELRYRDATEPALQRLLRKARELRANIQK